MNHSKLYRNARFLDFLQKGLEDSDKLYQKLRLLKNKRPALLIALHESPFHIDFLASGRAFIKAESGLFYKH